MQCHCTKDILCKTVRFWCGTRAKAQIGTFATSEQLFCNPKGSKREKTKKRAYIECVKQAHAERLCRQELLPEGLLAQLHKAASLKDQGPPRHILCAVPGVAHFHIWHSTRWPHHKAMQRFVDARSGTVLAVRMIEPGCLTGLSSASCLLSCCFGYASAHGASCFFGHLLMQKTPKLFSAWPLCARR